MDKRDSRATHKAMRHFSSKIVVNPQSSPANSISKLFPQDAEDTPVVIGERVGAPILSTVVPTAPPITRASSATPSGSSSRSSSSRTLQTMEKTGTWSVPGCGRASGTGGTRFTDGDLSRSSVGLLTAGAKHAPEDVSAVGGGEDVADRGPVLIACGQGQSMYDVKGCLSSWALVGSSHYREPRDKGLAGGKGGGGGSSKGRYGGEGVGDKTSDRHGNAGGLELGADSWTLRSKPTAAGDGGVMCSACVPFSEYGEVLGSRMLITGGKDSVLREWEVVDGRPRLSAEIPG